MRRAFACLALFACLAAAPVLALEVDKAELESAKDANIAFVNYEGPQSRIDSLAEIKGLGAALGAEARKAGLVPARFGNAARYRVIRAVDPSVAEGLDADILILGPEAQVDHVRNLRWIIAGYLSAAWGYSEKDAYLLATFVTYYDALHRGDMGFFGSKYKKVVTAELSAETAGLSIRYTEWPGKSAIVIPLGSGAKPGSLGAIDTGAVAGKDVAESLRAEPGKGVPERQEMTGLKEREAAELKGKAEEQKAEISRSEADIAAEKAKIEAERAKLEADKKAAADKAAADKAAADKIAAETGAPPPKNEATEAEKAAEQEKLAEREAEVSAAETKVAAKEETVAAKKEEAAKTEAAATAKEAEAAEDRKDITKDQKEVIAAEVAAKGAVEAAGVYLLQVVDATYPFARVVFVDAEKGNLIRASRLNSIRGRSIVDSGDSFVAVAGKEGGSGAVRLVRVDKASLEVVAQGTVDVYPESQVWMIGDRFYAVAKGEAGAYHLARFDAELKEQARSTEGVNPFTFLSEAAGGLAVQTPSGSFAILDKQSLAKTKELKP